MTDDATPTPKLNYAPPREKTVADAEDGQRLDRWCKQHWPDVPYGLLQKASRKGLLRLDGKRSAPDVRIAAGQTVQLRGIPVHAPSQGTHGAKRAPSPKDGEMIRRSILRQTPQYFVINKPAGLAVQGGSGQTRHVDGLLDVLADVQGQRPKLVHRLDRDTSGVLLLARTARAAAQLAEGFAEKTIHKVYWALVEGTPPKSRGKITLPIAKGAPGGDREKMYIDEELGQEAETHYRVVHRSHEDRYTWVELMPITGRTHQLRVHMAALGCPILGDGKYGYPQPKGSITPLHLHAQRVVVGEEVLGEEVNISAPLPEHMVTSWKRLQWPLKDDGVSLLEVGL